MRVAGKSLFLCLILLAGCHRDPKVVRDKYFQSGQQYFKSGRYEEAAIQFRNALQIDNEHVASYVGLASVLQQLDDHKGAIAIFRRVVELDSRNIDARLEFGRYLLGAGMQNPELFKRAREMAEQVLKIDPSNLEARILLGNAYAGLNDNENAIREMRRALSADPGNLSASLGVGTIEFRQQQTDKAEQTFKEVLEKHPDSIQAQLAIAVFYHSTKNDQLAEVHFKKAFDLAPAQASSLYSLVSFYLSMGKAKEAEDVFKAAIARRPEAREPRWGLANYYLGKGRIDEGVQCLVDLVKQNPKDRLGQLRLAEVYLSQKKDEDAERIIRPLLASNKNDAEAHYLLGKLMIARGQSDKALEEFAQASKFKDSLIAPYLGTAALLASRGDLKGAQNVLNEALRRDHNSLPVRAALARVLAYLGKPEDAIREAELILQTQPGNEDALAAHAEALRSLGKFDQSEAEFLKLCELRPRNPLYLHRLGWVKVARRDTAGAIVLFRKALELQADFAPALNDLLYLHTQAKRFDLALQEIDRLAKFSAAQDEIHSLRGRVYLAQKDESSAELEFNKAIEANSNNYQAYIFLGQIHLEKNELQQALQDLDQLIAKNSRFAPAYLLKGLFLQKAKDDTGAMANYRKNLELDPGNLVAANNLAWLLCENGLNIGEALSLAQAARKKYPESPEIADTLGWIYYKQNNNVLAVDQLLFSVNKRTKPQAEHYYRLGMAYYAKGDVQHAKQTLKKALELDPKLPGASDAQKILSSPG